MIMKRFLLLFCLLFVPCLAAQAETYRVEDIPNVQRADRTRYVSNPDGILSDEAVAHIDRLCAALRERAVAQVAVVAVDDIAGGDVFDFAIDLFSAWGVGQARNDNGLGILLVKDRREIRFVTGGGLEGVLPDAICKRIQLKYMLPAFRQGDYSLGMVQGVEAVSQLLEGSELDLGGTDTAGDELPAWAVFLIVTGFVVVPMGVILLGYYARKRCPKCHKLTLRQQSSDAQLPAGRIYLRLLELRRRGQTAGQKPARRQFRRRRGRRHDHRGAWFRRLRRRVARRRFRRWFVRWRRCRLALVKAAGRAGRLCRLRAAVCRTKAGFAGGRNGFPGPDGIRLE